MTLKALCVCRIFVLILFASIFFFNIVSAYASDVSGRDAVELKKNDDNNPGKQDAGKNKKKNLKKNAGFDFDRPPATNYPLTPQLSIGAYFEIKYSYEKNYHLDRNDPDDLWRLEPKLSLGLAYIPTKKITSYINIEAIRFIIGDEENKKNDKSELNLKLAYLKFNDYFADGLILKIGRQCFKDRREWLYDEEFDALRAVYHQKRFFLDLAVGEMRSKNLLEDIINEKVTNYILLGRYAGKTDTEFSLYSIVHDDRKDTGQNPVFFGLRIDGTWIDRLKYWIDAAYVCGKNQSATISGYGFDIGGTYGWKTALKPSLTLSVAYGSGNDNSSDGTDKNFRQTGYQDNDTAFNGLARIKYYGEVFDPELSNLLIYTVGFGIRPTSRFSIDLFSHYFRQNHAADFLRDADIDDDPEGIHKEIGYEVDIAVGYKITKRVKTTLTAGYFLPGNAFSKDADPAGLIECKFRFKF